MAAIKRRSGVSARRGFTLAELLVVIGIAVTLMAMSVPVGRSLREGNRMIGCKSQMRQIGQALRMYHTDEGGVPPFYIETYQDPNSDAPTGPGLTALYRTGYLGKQMTLHCPRDVYTPAGSQDFFRSYMVEDVDAKPSTNRLNRYPYLPFRGVTLDTDPNYRRQLQPGAVPPGGSEPVPVVDPNWHPADDTVVTWCPWHLESVTMGGVGQYNVLFWDGSVIRVGEDVMTVDGVGPVETWQVSRDDASGG